MMMITGVLRKGFSLGKAFSFIGANIIPISILILGVIAYKNDWFQRLFSGAAKPLTMEQNGEYPYSLLTDEIALQIANRLHSAMSSWGTDEDVIRLEFERMTVNDAVKVYNQFGERYYSRIFGEESIAGLSSKHNLSVWLTNELSSVDPAYIAAVEKLEPHNLI